MRSPRGKRRAMPGLGDVRRLDPPSDLIVGELYGSERLAAHARQLARRQKVAPRGTGATKGRGRGLLLSRLDATERVLRSVHGALAKVATAGHAVSPAGEWLLDNFYVVLDQAREIRATLPSGYYHELPKLVGDGPLAGYPRVYEIASELIAHTDGRLEEASVALMIKQYQRVTPLTMGELWAVPAMLRMGFLENVRHMAVRAARDATDTQSADEWVYRLLEAEKAKDDTLARALGDLVNRPPELTPAFLMRFLQQIRSRRSDFTPLLWLEQWVAEDVMTVEEAVQRSTQHLAITQLVMANSIASLRAVGNMDWPKFVESTSATEAILRRDPAGVYPAMTFATRDHYRHVVEQLSRGSDIAEQDVATAAIVAARAVKGGNGGYSAAAHVGYHLVDDGRPPLEAALGYEPEWRERMLRAMQGMPAAVYVATLAVLVAVTLAALLEPLEGTLRWMSIVAIVLALAPAMDVAVSLVNQLVMLLVPPARLPRMEFKNGVPERCRTVVVVPILVSSPASVHDALEHLEAQYLANRDREIHFALLTDFTDAASAAMPGDDAIVQAIVHGIRALNEEYGNESSGLLARPFLALHRPRLRNDADGVWMGWERKRGKLTQFNRLVLGSDASAFATIEGDVEWLHGVRYVITLDSDTVLPRDAAAALIGSMAHPLNVPEMSESLGRVVRGYGIMQPRVSVSLASANESRYSAIFAGHPGVDPYTTAVSDVYQDLFGEGTFTGKGIYDVAVFEHAIQGRFPANSLLSHDLIEGSFARAGLVTDVEVFDDYPTRYLTGTRRQHRWIRGDWQLLPWLGSFVPGPKGRTINPLSSLSRWKIFDNMRRSATPIALLAWLVAGATVLPHAGLEWLVAALAALSAPWLVPLLIAALRPPRSASWTPYYAGIAHDLAAAARQVLLAIVTMPHQALVAADAIVRTLWRLLRTRRHLLEWQTASQVEQASTGGRAVVWGRMWSATAAAAALLAVMWWHELSRPGRGDPRMLAALAALSLAWLLAPEAAYLLSQPRVRADLRLKAAERETVLRYARSHWHYFEQFATAASHWLVPDNFQETPEPVVATRTSPTNIGLQLLATVSAFDLGFIALDALLERLEGALSAVETMTKVRGHLMNWYDLSDLRVLDPPYLSAVDSGNLAGHLIAVCQACLSIADDTAPLAARLQAVASRARVIAMDMDFSLFYDEQRRLLSIGYDPRTGRLDVSAYDLLASEARLASFLAVAKGDVPAEHWFHLGRTLTMADGATALVSWSGSMFEYLMPVLVMPSRPGSLLDQTHRAAVRRQESYGVSRHVPWGISESAYNRRDRHQTYQYRAFGVPDLALKRGLAAELVVAPYASALALAVDPHAALRNLADIERLGVLGEYGFHDAIDYTRPEEGEVFTVVRSFMAHHIGMTLVALDNAANLVNGEGIWQRRFMRDPAVRAAALLLDERVPRRYTTQPVQSDAPAEPHERPAPEQPVVRDFATAETPEPRIGLLGGQAYCTLLTNAGSGYSRADGRDVFRWRADETRDDTGQWIYLRDLTSGGLWSSAHQPVRVIASSYRASFSPDRVVFERVDGAVETLTEIVVVPHERTEIRRVTLTNRSRMDREVELTSYGEIVLADPAADRAHPAFQNLFVETEWVPTHSAILASRRPRAPEDRRMWCAHVVATSTELVGDVSCETDRARFIGRGRTVADPAALDPGAGLSGTAGTVLDPIAALRVRVKLEGNRATTVAFTTVVADSRDEALMYADRHRSLAAAERALALSWTEAQVELRDLDVTSADAALYQELAGALIFPREALRAPQHERASNRRGQSALWAHGISGDWPIVLATIRDTVGLPSVRQLLVAHHYWRLKGIKADLVILNAKEPSYIQELQDMLTATVVSSSEGGIRELPGGVYIRRGDIMPPEDVALLRATAHIHVVCDGVGMGEIVAATVRPPADPERIELPAPPAGPAPIRPSGDFPTTGDSGNGYGALTPQHDYAITVSGAHVPPAPWANVIANPRAGFCVTERGGGFTWVENSFFYRLTPWFNDPVSDPCGEVLYLQDAATGRTWTPTPGPTAARDEAGRVPAYRVVHSPGRSTFSHTRNDITSELTLAVPEGDPVKISRLRLTNRGTQPRELVLTSYVEWALGAQREQTRHQLHTRPDEQTGAIFAQNLFAEDFAGRVAFSWISEPVSSRTANRGAFIGRNGDLAKPAALQYDPLTQTTGAGYDPCAALRCRLMIAAGETREVVVLLGAAENDDEARAIIARCGAPTPANAAITAATDAWERRLSTIAVHTPSVEFDALVNRWSLYQALSCRMWARSALYQSSGAFGFRDQLQDGMAFVYSEPQVAREHLLRAASRQFLEGDVQHWWHEPSGRGVRTRFSDDLVWLPFCADHYVNVTGDTMLWDERATYLEMRALLPTDHEVYDKPVVSNESGTIYEHCVRALDRACTTGQHGLPLMGGGDWNDGMNRVGVDGHGESVWLAWFLVATLRRFAVHAERRGDAGVATRMRQRADAYVVAVERDGWDGKWYRRAYFDDGSPLGSESNGECEIDAIAQSWSVISGAGQAERATQAMQSVAERLVRDDDRMILLLTPPFDRTTHDPGYIKGYVPGVRENGAQYTHAALWTVLAAVGLNDHVRAFHYYDLLNPFTHARTPADAERYKVEPYVVCADVYDATGHVGRGGWTWYTGSASWSYRVAVEGILGFRKRGDVLTISPCLPSEWPEATITYRHGDATYEILIRNAVAGSVASVTVGNVPSADGRIQLSRERGTHRVLVQLG